MSPLEDTLIKLAQTLSDNNIPYMIIGGMANAVWGEPRATLDNATIWVDEDRTDNVISILDGPFRPLVSDPRIFIHDANVFPLESEESVRVDLIFGKLPYELEAIERSIEIMVEGVPVHFCTPEDLILHKIISERERDINDAPGVSIKRMKNLYLTILNRAFASYPLPLNVRKFGNLGLSGNELYQKRKITTRD